MEKTDLIRKIVFKNGTSICAKRNNSLLKIHYLDEYNPIAQNRSVNTTHFFVEMITRNNERMYLSGTNAIEGFLFDETKTLFNSDTIHFITYY